jgi:hypothetical protein
MPASRYMPKPAATAEGDRGMAWGTGRDGRHAGRTIEAHGVPSGTLRGANAESRYAVLQHGSVSGSNAWRRDRMTAHWQQMHGPCGNTRPALLNDAGRAAARLSSDRYLVDPASSHMLVSKIKPCMSKYKCVYSETAQGSLHQLSFT